VAFQCRQKSGGRFPYAFEEFFLLAQTFSTSPTNVWVFKLSICSSIRRLSSSRDFGRLRRYIFSRSPGNPLEVAPTPMLSLILPVSQK